jgi:hypothetical protein
VSRRAGAFFSPRLDPVLDRGTGHTDPVVSPPVPAGRPGGQAVLNHQPHRQIDHAMAVVTARWGQIGQVRMEGCATRGAVMLRRGAHESTRTPQVEMAQVVQRPLGLLVSIGHRTTTRTRVPFVMAAVGNHLWLGQVGSGGHPFAGIGSIRTRTDPGFVLLVRLLGPALDDTCPSGTIPKPGKDAIVSQILGLTFTPEVLFQANQLIR